MLSMPTPAPQALTNSLRHVAAYFGADGGLREWWLPVSPNFRTVAHTTAAKPGKSQKPQACPLSWDQAAAFLSPNISERR
jgi:hypothetical protein